MALTNPKKIINVELLKDYSDKIKALFAKQSDLTATNAIVSSLNTDPVTKTYVDTADTALDTALTTETTNRTNADTAINSKIPTAASSTNKLTDKAYVDGQISSMAATFRGNFDNKHTPAASGNTTLDGYTGAKDHNDLAVVQDDETHSHQCWMYQYDGTNWVARYKLNDTPFSSAQMAAINSGITAALVAVVNQLPTTVVQEDFTYTVDDGGGASHTVVKTHLLKG